MRRDGLRIQLMLWAVLVLGGIWFATGISHAAEFENETTGGVVSENIHGQDYKWNWYHPVYSYLFDNADGSFSRVEYLSGSIYCEYYDAEFRYLTSQTIELELPEFGGLYRSKDGFWFVVEGQSNAQHVPGQTEFRIVKYDKDWNRVISTDLPDANTSKPFFAGCCRFAEKDGMLFVRTCHEMYNGHQASAMFQIKMEDCNIVTANYDVANSAYGYISHSFNQFLTVRDGVLFACDHGDSYLRGITMMSYQELMEGTRSFSNRVTAVNAFPFKGAVGNNYTGAVLGGFAVSTTHAIAAGASVPQEENVSGEVKNVFVTAVDLKKFEDAGKSFQWITEYPQDGNRMVSNVQFAEAGTDRYLLLWEEYVDDAFDRMAYVLLDGKGKPSGQVRYIRANLSDCQPVVKGQNAIWYVTDKSSPVFYQLPLDHEVPAAAKNAKFTKNGITYQVTKSSKTAGKVSVVGYVKKQMEKSVTIPSKLFYNGYAYTVTAVSAGAFKKCKKMTGIDLPDTVKSIGAQAFLNCKKLTVLKVGYSKYKSSKVGADAFKGTPKKLAVIVPDKKLSAYRKLFRKKGMKTGTQFYKQSDAWYYY